MEDVRRILEDCRRVAILGAHVNAAKAASYVPDYLHGNGYSIYPINPRFVGQTSWGQPFRAALTDIEVEVDMVDVFRRAEHLPAHLEEILAMTPLPKVVWLQLGIRNDDFAGALSARGIEVVQDRCTLADHRSLGMTPFA